MQYRIGQIVPSSNVTMEIEVPRILCCGERVLSDQLSFHSARVHMKDVTQRELGFMRSRTFNALDDLLDISPDIIVFVCLVAVMTAGPGYHREFESTIAKHINQQGKKAKTITSAGAIIQTLHQLNVASISLICPYSDDLTGIVLEYIENENINIASYKNLSVTDNEAVGRLDPKKLIDYAKEIYTKSADCLVISACVQMPSLPVIQTVEDSIGQPVISASSATAYQILRKLSLDTHIPNMGVLFS
ncbi:Asp/Glu racemase [Microbulbifer variabilis]|uniref:maleate cis-trans isomerase family protein n=1 Tax=Microbulbifer variabilis TaxID=266805 RepID=UPI001CFD823B|nr:Asp/Glu racemase [Microbulbifer variabilis]